ncbi:TetR family transcriptional regulator [Mycolicibacterium moriokaense]|jgi:AcrR family transcriptional regulator|uniref:Transcriptional regulator, TetR family protein n=1 Tax=Mycolicibacterium moriokaense TaxID=39691 RepID=A0AAD1HA85_9MYCO|nr:TetR/AcrR family transcriptional regulator [Mycolicibacterium moriokaense]MCV7041878.1 TetR/AcrR family transcriptional regulator [Mycolicibacterium moriokaense]ORB20639.1 TetR family transcriptional regulator [Mycolicibacterium moriokaense]BBX01334.1 putative transcriptional regulator, TetR family protein [Mycolicibacterium moriokaense]
MTAVTDRDRVGGDELRKLERIRRAALKSFATRGAAATSLRSVAADAGVSLGLVQHHFETKAGLIKAVDDYVLSVVIDVVSQPVSSPPGDSIADMGSRVTTLLLEHPDVVDYFGRALIDGSRLGNTIWDTLYAFGTVRWTARKERGEARDDIDVTWAAVNSLVLAVGTLIVRGHIERQVPDAFTTPEQLDRWQNSVNTLLREGLYP